MKFPPNKYTDEPRWQYNWLLAFGFVLMALAINGVYRHRVLSYDEVRYLHMAMLQRVTEYPYSYRVLEPWLVHILPLPIAWSFQLVTVGSLIGTGLIIYKWSLHRGLPPLAGLFGGWLFALSYATTFNLYHQHLVDPLALFIITWSLWNAEERRDAAVALLLLAGVLTKESALFVVPVFVLGRLREWRRTLFALPALGLFFLVRALHWFGPSTSNYTLVQVEQVLHYQVATYGGLLPALTIAVWASCGVLWIAGAIGYVHHFRANVEAPKHGAPLSGVRATGLFILFVWVQLVLGGDWTRMLSVALPVVILYAMEGLWNMSRVGLTSLLLLNLVCVFVVLPLGMYLLYLPFPIGTAVVIILRMMGHLRESERCRRTPTV